MGHRPRIVLLGKQGAGKGTQAVRLAQHYGIAHLSTGDLFRAQAKAGTVFGLDAKRYMDRGELVPDRIVLGVIEECLAPGGPLSDGFVLDGFPRTRTQAQALEGLLSSQPIDVVVHLDVPEEVVVERLSQRRVCVNNGAHIYSVTSPPTTDWTCDLCGGDVVQRDDDMPAAISKRLKAFERSTRPIINFYRSTGRVVADIDGLGDADVVFARLQAYVDSVMA
jgi:adenylate kinase